MVRARVELRVEGNTRHLAIVANLATMLGLLGTITGMTPPSA
jgi:biopolymer transport protein ExbB/TolQ